MSTLDFVGPNGGAAAVRGMTPAAVAARPAETTTGGDPLVRIAGLTVAFDDGKRHVPVLHGIDLEVRPGETIGIVGESGCGKSVTWLAVLRLLGKKARIGGTVSLDGAPIIDFSDRSMARIRGKRIAMIFQDPASSLNPVHRIGQQLTEALALHRGLTGQAAKAEAIRLRDRLIADEPTTALDATIQAQILDLLREIRQDSGMAMALISHDLGVIADICERVMVMYAGRVVETAPTNQLFANPGHPYTRGLLAALPDLGAPQRRLEAIPGTVPEPGKLPSGCSFRPRCVHAEEACGAEVPGLGFIEKTHQVACLKVDSL